MTKTQRNLRTIIHILTGILALCAGVLGYSDKLQVIKAIDPELAKYWFEFFVAAGIIEKCAKIAIDWLQPLVDAPPSDPPRSTPIAGRVPLAALIALSLFMAGCTTVSRTVGDKTTTTRQIDQKAVAHVETVAAPFLQTVLQIGLGALVHAFIPQPSQ